MLLPGLTKQESAMGKMIVVSTAFVPIAALDRVSRAEGLTFAPMSSNENSFGCHLASKSRSDMQKASAVCFHPDLYTTSKKMDSFSGCSNAVHVIGGRRPFHSAPFSRIGPGGFAPRGKEGPLAAIGDLRSQQSQGG